MAKSYLKEKDMVYDPKKMYAVTNWSEEELEVNWKESPNPDLGINGDNVYVLHAGETKTYPEYLAFYITDIFVDREMYRDAAKVPSNPDGTPSRQRERLEMAVVNKDLRKPYEDKTIQEIKEGQEDPAITKMRAEIRKQLIIEGGMGELTSELKNNADGTEKEEFPDVKKKAKKVVTE